MKKAIKHTLAILLAALMTLGISVAANAAAPPMTPQEETLLAQLRQLYEDAYTLNNEGIAESGNYTVQPQYSALPLVAGQLNEKVSRAAVMGLNTIRLGAGLPLLAWSETQSTAAQHMATLVAYGSSQGLPDVGHGMAKPAGVSDDYYAVVQTPYGGENLFYGSYPLGSLLNALSDAASSPPTIGHRYNLLNPNWTEIGIGWVPAGMFGQGCHRLIGSQASGVDMVAWPSRGLMPNELFSGGVWSASFYQDYSTTAQTKVLVTCLNTNAAWTFRPGDPETGDHIYKVAGSAVQFYDQTLSATADTGMVYEITLTDLTGKGSSYTYRSRFVNASKRSDGGAPSLSGPTAMTLAAGYAATSTGAFTVGGNPAPMVTLSNNYGGKITWNNSTKKLDIAVGLEAGTYPVTLTANNGVPPNATASFTLTVSAASDIDGPKHVGLFGLHTKWESTIWNWIMFIFLFGWIWMWF